MKRLAILGVRNDMVTEIFLEPRLFSPTCVETPSDFTQPPTASKKALPPLET